MSKLINFPNKPTECVDKKKDVCSDNEIINRMVKFLKLDGNYEKREIINKMKRILNCNSESCVLLSTEMKKIVPNYLIKKNIKNFMPKGPSHSKKWLSNVNIDEVLDVWEKELKDINFLHIYFQMIDFEEHQTSLSINNFIKTIKGYDAFGVVINTDKSSGEGKHWFALYGDFVSDPMSLEYFNSTGGGYAPNEIIHWMNHVKSKLGNVIIKYIFDIKHQTDSHSCGVYSLYYIWCRLNGVPSEYFKKYTITSEMMVDLRKNLFRWY